VIWRGMSSGDPTVIMRYSRRDFVIGSALLFSPALVHAGAFDRIVEIEKTLGGRIGVSALNTANGDRVRHRSDERFAMCSTFKAALVGAVLARCDHGDLALNQQIKFGESDLLVNAPMTTAHLGEGALSVEMLCAAAVEVSDNTAANLLLSLIGGPPQVTAFFRSLGDNLSRLDRMELDLNSNLPDDPRDTTTPDAMASNLKSLLVDEEALSAASRSRLTNWMLNEQNGRNRIRLGLPAGWRVANKPGSSADKAGATNDIAVAWPPDRAPIVISVYTDAREATPERRTMAIAEIARVIGASLV
jgi:beta-lactamase class A